MAEEILDLPSWRMRNGDLLQNLGLMKWITQDDPDMLKAITGLRIGYELYSRVSANQEIDTYQAMCYAAIADYLKKHPGASEKDITKEVAKQVQIFKDRIENL